MKLILLRPRGFCAGVNRAVQMLTKTCNGSQEPIYVLHEIVHNYWVVEGFKKKGVRFVETLDPIPEGGTVLFSAHGVAPAVREEAIRRGLKTIDATCPLVASLHNLARKFASEGWHIFLIGHKGHQEVIGTLGEAPDQMTLVSSIEEAEMLPPPETWGNDAKFTYLTQTTLSDQGWRSIVSAIRAKFHNLKDPSNAGVCFATRNRQEAVQTAAPEADALLVVGSPNSSNSKRLAEIGENSGTPSYLINGPDDINPAIFKETDRLLMTAGASAPEEIFCRCISKLSEHFNVEISERVICEESVAFR